MTWMDGAACLGLDTATFFPNHSDGGRRVERALTVCRRCPVVRPCLRYALCVDVAGVWGATTHPQRVALRLEHNIHPIGAESAAAADLTLGGTCT